MREAQVDFAALKIDALLVSAPANVRYLSGFTGSNGMLLVERGGERVFFTDPRYTLQSRSEVAGRIRVVPRGPLLAAAAAWIARRKLRRVGFEAGHLSCSSYVFLDENCGGARLLRTAGIVEQQRMVKDPDEIGKIRASVATCSAAFRRVQGWIRAGRTESEIAAELDYRMRREGAEGPAFETIVASRERTALPHARPTSRTVGHNELVLIDVGSFQDGYASDMTRMLHLGRVPQPVRKLYDAVLEAQLAAIGAVREGVPAENVDRAARNVLKRHGLDRQFTHSTGHGLGLEIHEPPRIGRKDKTRLRAGMTITIEPGVYIENLGGVRIEDTVLVTSTGCEVLTPTPKELVTL